MKKIVILIFCVSILFVLTSAAFAADVIWSAKALINVDVSPGTMEEEILKLKVINTSTIQDYDIKAITVTFYGNPSNAWENIEGDTVNLWWDVDGAYPYDPDCLSTQTFSGGPATICFSSPDKLKSLGLGATRYLFVTYDLKAYTVTEGDIIDVEISTTSHIQIKQGGANVVFEPAGQPLNSDGVDTVKVDATKYLVEVSTGDVVAVAGRPFDVIVRAVDQYGNQDKNYNSEGSLTQLTGLFNSPKGNSPEMGSPFQWTGSESEQVVQVTGFSAGTQPIWGLGSLSASDTDYVTIVAGELTLNTDSIEVQSGDELGFSFELEDPYGNGIPAGTFTITTVPTAELSEGTTVLTGGITSYYGSVKFEKAGTYTLKVTRFTDAYEYDHSATRQITVKHAPIAKYKIERVDKGSIYPGVPFKIKITAYDEFDNVITDLPCTHSVKLETDDTDVTISPKEVSGFVNGVWEGEVILGGAGDSVTISCSANGKSSGNDSLSILKVKEYTAMQKTMVYPNPWTPGEGVITIQYYLTENTNVEVRIYTLTGELVKRWPEFQEGEEHACIGVNLLKWDGTDKDGNIVGSGGYICAVDKKYEDGTKRDFTKIAVIRK